MDTLRYHPGMDIIGSAFASLACVMETLPYKDTNR